MLVYVMNTRFRCVFFSAFLALAAISPTMPVQAADGLSDLQRSEVETLIHKYIMENPRVILDAVQQMQAREEEEQKLAAAKNLVTYREQLINDPKAPVLGNPNGDITIVEFFDYRCGYCKRVFPTLLKAMEDDGNLRLVYKEFPILGPDSIIATKASLAVWRLTPDKYQAYHTALMAARGGLNESTVLAVADKIGLDSDAIAKEMKSPEIEQDLNKNYELAQALGISGTPAFVIGNQLVPGAVDLETLKNLIKEARGS